MIPEATRDEILAVFADLAEEDPTVLRDLLLRVARWERQPPAYWVAGPWREVDDGLWVRDAAQIGRAGRRLAQVTRRIGDGLWNLRVDGTMFGAARATAEQARDDADDWLRGEGWLLPEDSTLGACTCTGPARDAHDHGCPVRIANPRVDLGDEPRRRRAR